MHGSQVVQAAGTCVDKLYVQSTLHMYTCVLKCCLPCPVSIVTVLPFPPSITSCVNLYSFCPTFVVVSSCARWLPSPSYHSRLARLYVVPNFLSRSLICAYWSCIASPLFLVFECWSCVASPLSLVVRSCWSCVASRLSRRSRMLVVRRFAYLSRHSRVGSASLRRSLSSFAH